MCHTLSQGVAALFGPTSPFTAHHVQAICDSKEIPHIETRWDYRTGPRREQYSINLFPFPPTLSKVSDDRTGNEFACRILILLQQYVSLQQPR